MTQKKTNAETGRPKQYDEGMLRSVISEMLANGTSAADIHEKSVKPILCEKHDVSETINTGSLTKHVATVLDAVVAEQNEALLAGLPTHVRPAMDDLLARVKQDMLLMVALQNDTCQQEAERECKILRQDKANANWRIAELESDAGRLEEQVTKLEQMKADLEAELATARETVTALESKLVQHGPETRTVGMLIAEVRGDPAARKDLQEFFSQIVADRGEQPRSA